MTRPPTVAPHFRVVARSAGSSARAGVLSTPHGEVYTPAFFPVGTSGTVRGLLPTLLEGAGVQGILANAYHLETGPGSALIEELGGLHAFCGWSRPILTDSGGYQVFSLARRAQVEESGVRFRLPDSGREVAWTPEDVIRVQVALGADILMPLDEPVPWDAPAARSREALDRTISWWGRSRAVPLRPGAALYAILQGGTDLDLRREAAQRAAATSPPGFALGGLGLGEPRALRRDILAETAGILPEDRPRYLMGIGPPEEILEAIACGIDMFDCVVPTRNGRNGWAYSPEGVLRLRNRRFRDDQAPVDEECPCPACTRFPRAFLHHLFHRREMLGPVLLSLHNISYIVRVVDRARRGCTVPVADIHETLPGATERT